ncbi:Aldo/keto reductase [Artomyces pyxidatus]|uniref:Aldo/keto reductase n=1 Tax=Artomyces pyxidatus TaxID=48021 RepID=A0ACB8SS85_9AGAM|nr:Aldo/keto reductase [Artomyces pyxidatus]
MSVQPKKMPYVRLGKSGLKVSRIILGCMSFGSPEWEPWVLNEEEGLKQIKAAYDAGIQTFDTADTYSNGLSEVILGKAIKQFNFPRDEIVVMTKVFGLVARTPGENYYTTPDLNPEQLGYVNQQGLSRKHIFDAVKHSLERLQLDYIDVLQCHRLDDTPVSEIMNALNDVVKAGYVRYIGMSSCYAWQFFELQSYALQHNLTPFISMQNHYNILYREEEREMMPVLKHFGVGSIPWSPLARGFVTRPVSQRTKRGDVDVWGNLYLAEHGGGNEIVKRVEELANKKGVSMAQLALAWILHKDVVAAPIVGTTSLEKLLDLLGALEVKLDADEIKYLDESYRNLPIIGHW